MTTSFSSAPLTRDEIELWTSSSALTDATVDKLSRYYTSTHANAVIRAELARGEVDRMRATINGRPRADVTGVCGTPGERLFWTGERLFWTLTLFSELADVHGSDDA